MPPRRRSRTAATPARAPRPAWVAGVLRAGPYVVLALAAVLLVVARVAPAWDYVFPAPGEIRYFDTDPYYHLRHTEFAVEHFPRLMRWDRGVYPHGAPALYAGLFDVVAAAIAHLVSGFDPTPETVMRVGAWMPVGLGVLSLLAAFRLASACAGPWGGAVAAVFLLLYPGTFMQRSLLGGFDHHGAEVLLALLIVLALVRCLERERGGTPAPWWRPAFGAALPLAALLFTWFGGPIHVGLVGLTLLVVATLSLLRGEPAGWVGRAAFRLAAGTLILSVVPALAAPWLVMSRETLAVALAALVALALGLPVYIRALEWAIGRGAPRAAVALGVPLLLGGALILGARSSEAAAKLLDVVVGTKTTLVTEQFAITLEQFVLSGGAPALLAFLALPVVIVDLRRRPATAPRVAAVVYGALIIALWLRTNDYNYLAGPVFAVMGALTTVAAARALRGAGARVAGGVALAAALAIPVPWIPDGAKPWPNKKILDTIMVVNDGWAEALRWLRDSSAPLARPLDAPPVRGAPAHPPGNYGVVANWTFGHFIAAIGGRPPVAAGGHHKQNTRSLLLEDEGEMLRALDALAGDGGEIRYVIVDPNSAGPYFGTMVKQTGGKVPDYTTTGTVRRRGGGEVKVYTYGDRYRHTMVARLFLDDGAGLDHFRLVYAARGKAAVVSVANPPDRPTGFRKLVTPPLTAATERVWKDIVKSREAVVLDVGLVYEPVIQPLVKIFERVRGARLTGQAAPGAMVEASVSLRARRAGHTFVHETRAVAGPDGRFELIVPYATEPDSGSDVVASSPYRVDIGGGPTVRVAVPSRAVLAGEEIEVTGPN